MATYIKMTNGAVKVLVDPQNKAVIDEWKEEGFYPELDKNNNFIFVESTDLITKDEDAETKEMLEALKRRQVGNKKPKSLASRSGK